MFDLLPGTKVESAEHFYSLRDSKMPHGRLPPGPNDADWTFEFISNKLLMVLFTHLGQDPKKVVSLAQKCGIEAYRLINVECDPLTVDTESVHVITSTCYERQLESSRSFKVSANSSHGCFICC